ncbi:MFS transporter [Methanobacterium aggregans]|uniref:MFS transporter n=1 Tax=Methanobacterium aggregans TaxID=1615586 RepID=UPI001AEB6C07|nr:MFS transporter [Methanobacterium aggregans]MBP2045648.1 MFS family permease [Methanobacterium aggregans]
MENEKSEENRDILKSNAWKFIILLGFVSLLADMTYEGARSITGPYLALLGASALTVAFVSGFGELIGYILRFFSGYLSDKTRRYWAITIVGYIINLLAVPLIALAGSWEIAAVLLITERLGKAVRTPARDVMLSHATSQVGSGWGFGIHEAMDQIGAILGPLIVALVLVLNGTYRTGFAVLIVPALLAIIVLIVSRFLYPRPHDMERTMPQLDMKGFKRNYWIYMAGVALLAAGFADFPIIAYHFQGQAIVSQAMIPVLYAVAMGVDALAALVFGRLFDREGVSIMVVVAVISSLFAPLIFLGGFYTALLGMALWGVGMGAQESIMRAAVALMAPSERRGVAYGAFNTVYGISWFAGSVVMGLLYGLSLFYLVAFSMIMQLASTPLFFSLRKMKAQKS